MSGRVCVLVSGGVDSSILVNELLSAGREVWPLYVRGGFYWEKAELHWAKRVLASLRSERLRPLTVVDSPMAGVLPGHWALTGRGVPPADAPWDEVYLPGRNLILLSQAGVFCALHDVPVVCLAILKGNPFADARPRFLKSMQSAVSEALHKKVRVETPYAKLTKKQVLARAGGTPLELTFSCLRPQGVNRCGKCSKCGERRDAERL